MNTTAAKSTSSGLTLPVMSDKAFHRLSEFIEANLGIKMPSAKKTMLQSRLQKRLRTLALDDFDAYCTYVLSPDGRERELSEFVNVVTTNKTDFFREPRQFDFLIQTVLPDMMSGSAGLSRRIIKVWSAGCSTGEEPYSLAMVLDDFLEPYRGVRFSILATDISTRVLDEAKAGIYTEVEAEPISLNLKKKYLLRSKDRGKNQVRIVSSLRKTVRFGKFNLMSNADLPEKLDIIFCRNVLIYFSKFDQERVITLLCRHLYPGGFLFIGHSETLNGFRLPLKQVMPTVYRKTET